jgi:transcriptional regulator with GAF, ATPase, and Fis domain
MHDREEWLARTFIELADTLVTDYDVIDFMSILVERCAELQECTEVALALVNPQGQLQPLASTTERVRVLELIEIQNQEGPCLECFLSGTPVVNQRMDESESRWPSFTSRVRAEGFVMVHAIPLRLRENTIGAMNIFNTELREITPLELSLAQALADAATIGVLHERAVSQGTLLTHQLQVALSSRIVIEQAKGIVAERLRLDMDRAFDVLRRYARNNRTRLGEVAAAIVESTLSVDEMSSSPADASFLKPGRTTT